MGDGSNHRMFAEIFSPAGSASLNATPVSASEGFGLLMLKLIEVDYEILPFVLSPEDALAHPEIKVNEKAKVGNITKHVQLEFGPVDEALASAAAISRQTYKYAGSTHALFTLAHRPHWACGDWRWRGRDRSNRDRLRRARLHRSQDIALG